MIARAGGKSARTVNFGSLSEIGQAESVILLLPIERDRFYHSRGRTDDLPVAAVNDLTG